MAAPASIAASLLALTALCLAGCELPPPATEEEVAAHEELDRLMLSPPPGMSEAERADRIVALYPKPRKLPGMGHYERVHEYAATALPAAVAMQRRYPKTDHFITHFGFRGEPTNTWNTESFFGDRYTLTMQVEIAIDHDAETFRPVGPPTFFLLEAESATIDGGAKYRNQVTFGPDEFEALVESGWDLSTVGVEFDEEPVPLWGVHEAMARAPRYPIDLLNAGGRE